MFSLWQTTFFEQLLIHKVYHILDITKVISKWENIFLALRLDGHKFLHFLSHFGKKEIKNIMPRPGFKPTKIRLEAHGANYYTTDARWLLKQIFNLYKSLSFEVVLTSEITF